MGVCLFGAGCEAVPELRFAEADAAGPVPTIPAEAPEAEIARILDEDLDGAADAAAPLYERICSRPRAQAHCCDGSLLCAGKTRRCEVRCDACEAACAGSLCCILRRGAVDRCSDDRRECAKAVRRELADDGGA